MILENDSKGKTEKEKRKKKKKKNRSEVKRKKNRQAAHLPTKCRNNFENSCNFHS